MSVDTALEAGDARADPRAFRRALGHFGTGVAVITATGSPTPVGVTVNSFSSVSLDPPLVLWSAANTSSSLAAFRSADGFAVNVLAANQTDLSAQFARSGGDKFANVTQRPGRYDAPLLGGSVAQFECRKANEYAGGDHTIFIGEVERFSRFAGMPLIFAQGRYGVALDDPEQDRDIAPLAAHPGSYTVLTLLKRAYLARSSAFRREAAAAGLSVNESRVLYHLDANGRLNPASLARAALMDIASVEDAIRALAVRGLVATHDEGVVGNTEAGTRSILALRAISLAAEAEKVSHLPEDAVRGARRVLEAFGT